jgi:ABC-type phosphate/phosphonate transport system permease subunit
MTISMQTLNDTIVALITTVGIAVALSLAFVAASAFFQRSRKHGSQAVRAAHAPVQHPTQLDDARELVLR